MVYLIIAFFMFKFVLCIENIHSYLFTHIFFIFTVKHLESALIFLTLACEAMASFSVYNCHTNSLARLSSHVTPTSTVIKIYIHSCPLWSTDLFVCLDDDLFDAYGTPVEACCFNVILKALFGDNGRVQREEWTERTSTGRCGPNHLLKYSPSLETGGLWACQHQQSWVSQEHSYTLGFTGFPPWIYCSWTQSDVIFVVLLTGFSGMGFDGARAGNKVMV